MQCCEAFNAMPRREPSTGGTSAAGHSPSSQFRCIAVPIDDKSNHGAITQQKQGEDAGQEQGAAAFSFKEQRAKVRACSVAL